ncbi:MAG: FKBP-type peptidyl-prolyl cis-trans isomerase [Candidatus Kapabacteria bacterium]|nr:FKBP-type peptidyl-prolyl cis-trans isomerase [Candidatus Kapabacteria bacterium]
MRILRILPVVLCIGLAFTGCDNGGKELSTFKDSTSYAIGAQVGKSIVSSKFDVDPEVVAQAVTDAMNNSSQMSDSVIALAMNKLQESRRLQQAKEDESKAQGNIKAGKAFLEANKSKPGVVTTATGLQYMVVKEGTGAKPTSASVVKIHYTGKLIDGKVFDSSVERGQPVEFPVGGVIPGFSEALSLMSIGAKYMVYIPQELGYGMQSAGPIPPGSTLVFEIELLGIK